MRHARRAAWRGPAPWADVAAHRQRHGHCGGLCERLAGGESLGRRIQAVSVGLDSEVGNPGGAAHASASPGPELALEGRTVLQCFASGAFDAEVLVGGLSADLAAPRTPPLQAVSVELLHACGIDAALALRATAAASLRSGRQRLYRDGGSDDAHGREPIERKQQPRTAYEAKFSAPLYLRLRSARRRGIGAGALRLHRCAGRRATPDGTMERITVAADCSLRRPSSAPRTCGCNHTHKDGGQLSEKKRFWSIAGISGRLTSLTASRRCCRSSRTTPATPCRAMRATVLPRYSFQLEQHLHRPDHGRLSRAFMCDRRGRAAVPLSPALSPRGEGGIGRPVELCSSGCSSHSTRRFGRTANRSLWSCTSSSSPWSFARSRSRGPRAGCACPIRSCWSPEARCSGSFRSCRP